MIMMIMINLAMIPSTTSRNDCARVDEGKGVVLFLAKLLCITTSNFKIIYNSTSSIYGKACNEKCDGSAF